MGSTAEDVVYRVLFDMAAACMEITASSVFPNSFIIITAGCMATVTHRGCRDFEGFPGRAVLIHALA